MLEQWLRYNDILRWSVLQLRGRSPIEQTLDRQLLKLPVSLGGLGLGCHADMAPLAYGAAKKSSDQLLDSRLSF